MTNRCVMLINSSDEVLKPHLIVLIIVVCYIVASVGKPNVCRYCI